MADNAMAWVLVTALPPTKGHKRLIDYAANLSDRVGVILCTQPSEPFIDERYIALEEAYASHPRVSIIRHNQEIAQFPDADNPAPFWKMWRDILISYGLIPGDYIVASEMYGKTLAEVTGCTFFPYDINRDMLYTRATYVRNHPREKFTDILPEFQPYVTVTATIFGAESTGKTTLAREVTRGVHGVSGHYLTEWARPYLEATSPEITTKAMTTIWQGQGALQTSANNLVDKPFIIQDTDLFSTVGFWNNWNGQTPEQLIRDAVFNKSDLYLICPSNIPFETDPLRYGGTVRETSDQYWVDICEQYGLEYRVLKSKYLGNRIAEAGKILREYYDENISIDFVREVQ